MNRVLIGVLLCQAWLLLWSARLCAEPDPARLDWLDGQGIVVHWDNVERTPLQRDGPVPHYDRRHDLHTLTLQPGEQVRLRLAAGERLRIQAVDGGPDLAEVGFAWSNGSGLYLEEALSLSADRSALTSGAGHPVAGVVRVSRPAGSGKPLSVVLFTSRHADPVTIGSYPEVIGIPGMSPLRLSGRNSAADYWLLQDGQYVSLSVPGGRRLRLETRFAYPAAGDVPVQAYRISASLDGRPWRALAFETALDGGDPVAVDGCYTPVGRRVAGYLDIPAGDHHLELRSSAPVYLRLLGEQVPDAYLWDDNRSQHPAALQDAAATSGSEPGLTSVQVLGAVAATPLRLRDQQAALRLLQDNGWRDGNLAGAALLQRWSAEYPEENELRLLAQRAWSQHTAYRDLLPAGRDKPMAQRFAWFRLPVASDERRDTVVPENYAAALSDKMAGGYFLELPSGRTGRLEYSLPERTAATLLRFSVDRNSVQAPRRLYLQFDEQPARPLVLTGQPALPAKAWRPGRAEAALAVMNRTHTARGLTLAGPFAARNPAAPLVDVAQVELPLPREVRRIRVWSDEGGGSPLQVALQYRAGRFYQTAGTAYLSLLQTPGPETVYRQFLAALSGDGSGTLAGDAAADISTDRPVAGSGDVLRDLHNQWLPLLRLLHSRSSRLAGATPVQPAGSRNDARLAAADIRALRESALQARQAGDPVAELEAWTAIREGAAGPVQQEAVLAQVQVLEQLGESYLAEQQLLYNFVSSHDAAFRERVLERLLALYRRTGNDEARLNVLAAASTRYPDPAILRALAEALLAVGRTHFALQVALALPPEERPARLLLQASYLAGWWSLFDRTLADIRDPETRHWWAGWRAQADGDYTQALSQWDAAGSIAAAMRQQLADGMDIRSRLGAAEPEAREAAVQAWENWQSRAPGSRWWVSEPQLVTAHAGAATLHVIDQDLYMTAFRATPGVPVTLRVQGPVTLRLSLRPLHGEMDGAAINDWVTLETGGERTPFPVTDNRVAGGLELTGDGHVLAGLAETVEYRVAPGLHDIHVTPEGNPLLLDVAAERPVLPLTVLPPLLPATVQAALQGDLGDARAYPPGSPAVQKPVEVLQQCGVTRLVAGSGGNAIPPAARSAYADGGESYAGREKAAPAPEYHLVRHGETLSGIALRYGTPYRQLARLNALDPPYLIKTGQRLRLGRPGREGAIADTERDADAAVLGRMRRILWQAEHDRTQAVAMAAAGEVLFAQHPATPGLPEIMRRLHRLTVWEPVPAVQASAGVRTIEVAALSPETPALRIRRALLPARQAGEQVLSGYETLVFAVDQPVPGDFRIDLALGDLVPLEAQPMQVLVQLDDGPARALRLTPGQPRQRIRRRVPGGSHLLRVRIAEPVLNQYLGVVISEPGEGADDRRAGWSSRRNYHVATQEEPVIVSLEGPTRVRIDELRAGHIYSSYRSLAAGWQQLRLVPGPHQQQALYRIHRLVARQPAAAVPARKPAWAPLAVPRPATGQVMDAAPFRRVTIDRFAPGGQEDGTWSLAAALVRRRNVDEETTGDDRTEQFTELAATHRYFSEGLQGYFRSDLLLRLRSDGGPTLGLRGWINTDRTDWPFALALGGSLFTQQPDAATGDQWAASVRGALSRRFEISPRTAHRPAVSVYRRWLSLEQAPALHPGRVDQDLYTNYKHDHRYALGMTDTLSYRPWLDTLCYAQAGLASNEDFNVLDPDHATLALGASQLLQDWEVSAEYRIRRYFTDRDRSRASTQQRYQLSLDWLGWRDDRNGWQARMQFVWDDSSQALSGFLSLAWLHSNARFYRDYRPAELGFSSLRERRLQEQLFSAGSGASDVR